MTTQERIDKGLEFHRSGYNCAQSVLMSLADRLGIDAGLAATVSTGLGGGVGGQGEICGVATAMAVAESIVSGNDPAQKAAVYERVRGLCSQFRDRNNGMLLCRDLKRQPQARSCDMLIADGIEILCGMLDSRQQPEAR